MGKYTYEMVRDYFWVRDNLGMFVAPFSTEKNAQDYVDKMNGDIKLDEKKKKPKNIDLVHKIYKRVDEFFQKFPGYQVRVGYISGRGFLVEFPDNDLTKMLMTKRIYINSRTYESIGYYLNRYTELVEDHLAREDLAHCEVDLFAECDDKIVRLYEENDLLKIQAKNNEHILDYYIKLAHKYI